MDSLDRWCSLIIILGLIIALVGSELNSDARQTKQWKEAVSHGYAEQVIENDTIVLSGLFRQAQPPN